MTRFVRPAAYARKAGDVSCTREERAAWITRLACIGLTAFLAVPGSARAADENPAGPSVASRVLRALGLETPPGARGDKAYRRGDHEEALRRYGEALEENAGREPDRDAAVLDRHIGNALYRQGRYPEAIDRYGQALKSAAAAGLDSGFAADTYRNLGNAWYRKASAADTGGAVADMREAVAHYRKSLRVNPSDKDVKRNLEKANAALERLIRERQQQQQQQQPNQPPPEPPEPSARAKEALARAMQLTQERRYEEAATVLDGILRDDPSAASFAAHRKRLDDVMKILRGEAPADPTPRDPRARPWTPGTPGAGRAP